MHQLPLEVWAKIFEHFKPISENELASGPMVRRRISSNVMEDQADFHRLKLVCSKFRDAFAEHPELSNEINIDNTNAFMPSVLLWIQRWRSSIYRFNSFFEGQHQVIVLGALACPGSLLDSVSLTNAPADAVCALPGFSSLRRCYFLCNTDYVTDDDTDDDTDYDTDLSPLQALPSLEELHLSFGHYSSVPSTGHLTLLRLEHGTVQFRAASAEDISLFSSGQPQRRTSA